MELLALGFGASGAPKLGDCAKKPLRDEDMHYPRSRTEQHAVDLADDYIAFMK
jgi:hypothetical protein